MDARSRCDGCPFQRWNISKSPVAELAPSPRLVREQSLDSRIRHGVANMFNFKPVRGDRHGVAMPLAAQSPGFAQTNNCILGRPRRRRRWRWRSHGPGWWWRRLRGGGGGGEAAVTWAGPVVVAATFGRCRLVGGGLAAVRRRRIYPGLITGFGVGSVPRPYYDDYSTGIMTMVRPSRSFRAVATTSRIASSGSNHTMSGTYLGYDGNRHPCP